MEASAILAVWLAMALAGAMATLWWGRSLWTRRHQLAARTKVIASTAMVASVWGALSTVVGLVGLFGAAGGESVDPSQRARVLAEGISAAVNGIAFGLLLWLPT